MKIVIETNEYEIVKLPFEGKTKIIIYDYPSNKEAEDQEKSDK